MTILPSLSFRTFLFVREQDEQREKVQVGDKMVESDDQEKCMADRRRQDSPAKTK